MGGQNPTDIFDSQKAKITEYNTLIIDNLNFKPKITINENTYLIIICPIYSISSLNFIFNGGTVILNNKINFDVTLENDVVINSIIIINSGCELFFNIKNWEVYTIDIKNYFINHGLIKLNGRFILSKNSILNFGILLFRYSLTLSTSATIGLSNYGEIISNTAQKDLTHDTELIISKTRLFNDINSKFYLEKNTSLILKNNGTVRNDGVFKQKENSIIEIYDNGYIQNKNILSLDALLINNSDSQEQIINDINGVLTLENDFNVDKSGKSLHIKNSDVVISYKYKPNFSTVGKEATYLNIDNLKYIKGENEKSLAVEENIKECIFELNSSNINETALNTLIYLLNLKYNIKQSTTENNKEIIKLLKLILFKNV